MMPGTRDRQAGAPLAEINVTPLVDVMLVLFVIFLVMAPLLTHAIRIDLPKAAVGTVEHHGHTVTISIDGHGTIYVNGQQMTLANLEAVLAQRASQDPQMSVSLHADQDERFGQVAQVVAAIGRARIAHVAIATASPSSSSRGVTPVQ
jgi:biopolymer transport protein ExbD